MSRHISLPVSAVALVAVLTFCGCGGRSSETTFTPSAAQTPEELAEAAAYDAAYEAASREQSQQGN